MTENGLHNSISVHKEESLVHSNEFDHPVYKKISAANGRINKMTNIELLEALTYLKLGTKGTKEILQKRLKAQVKKQHLAENNLVANPKSCYVDYYVVIDFEATCDEPNPSGFQHEIIEFPAVLVKTSTLEIVSEFHSYCRPVINPVLSEFCKSLTGIMQVQVESSSVFEVVLQRFDKWLKQQVMPTETFCIATDGPWDLDRFLKNQCKTLNIQIPHYFHRWVNIRKHFYNYYKINQANVELMLQHLGMEFEGRPHRGIDDARNIARILIQLIRDGADPLINESLR
ncbi:3'-5' exoribonuclease 1 isoform X2 [Hydra vulgaris]|uniref:3'-5' exoribonuclease 1 isoform X2 n=1 Tax=Hydra vulgaris TaxID=6087 RepID=A0ABM4BH76_HYDVU